MRILLLMYGITSNMDLVSNQLFPALEHPILRTLSLKDQIDSIKAILHNHFREVASLQIQWNDHLVPIFMRTGPFETDAALMSDWEEQVTRLMYVKQRGFLSMISGDFDNCFGNCLESVDISAIREFLMGEGAEGQDETQADEELEESLGKDNLNLELQIEADELNNVLASPIV